MSFELGAALCLAIGRIRHDFIAKSTASIQRESILDGGRASVEGTRGAR